MEFEKNESGGRCEVAEGCVFAEGCKFDRFCVFGHGSKLGRGCEFAEGCKFDRGCKIQDAVIDSLLMLQCVDGSGRQIIVIKTGGEIHIQAGCFFGTLEEFCDKASREGKDRYVKVISAVAEAM